MLVTTIDSTTLATVVYDADRQLLWLEFQSRAVYCYLGVPPATHHELLTAPSKGAYFNRNIRGRFPFHKQRALPLLPQTLRS